MQNLRPITAFLLGIIVIFSCSNKETNPVNPEENDPEWMTYPFTFVRSLAIDNRDNIYAGFFGNYLAKFDGEKWSNFQPKIGTHAQSIDIDSKNRIWIGGGYTGRDPKLAVFENERWNIIDREDYGTGSGVVWKVACDRHDNVWVGTDAGIACFDGTIWQSFTPSDSTVVPGQVNSITFDRNGNVWVAAGDVSVESQYNGLYKYDGQTWLRFSTQNSGLPDDYVTAVAVDSAGYIWCGCGEVNGSLVKFDGSQWTVLNSQNSVLKSEQIGAITCDATGTVWIGENKKIYKFDGTTLTSINEPNSIKMYDIMDIIVDSKGIIWIGSGRGVVAYRVGGV